MISTYTISNHSKEVYLGQLATCGDVMISTYTISNHRKEVYLGQLETSAML